MADIMVCSQWKRTWKRKHSTMFLSSFHCYIFTKRQQISFPEGWSSTCNTNYVMTYTGLVHKTMVFSWKRWRYQMPFDRPVVKTFAPWFQFAFIHIAFLFWTMAMWQAFVFPVLCHSVDEQESRRINCSLLSLISKMEFISNVFTCGGDWWFLRDCWFKLYNVFTGGRGVKEPLNLYFDDWSVWKDPKISYTWNPFLNPLKLSTISTPFHLFGPRIPLLLPPSCIPPPPVLPRLPKGRSDRFSCYLNVDWLSKLLVLNGSHRIVTE